MLAANQCTAHTVHAYAGTPKYDGITDRQLTDRMFMCAAPVHWYWFIIIYTNSHAHTLTRADINAASLIWRPTTYNVSQTHTHTHSHPSTTLLRK